MTNAPFFLATLLFSLSTVCLSRAAEPVRSLHDVDVVVYGGTSAGIAAAVQTVEMGKKAIVIEPSMQMGGLTTSGLGWTDTGNKAVIGGIARRFYRDVKKHYDSRSNWRFQKRSEYDRYRAKDDAMWTFEPHVASAIFDRWMKRHSIPVLYGERLDRSRSGKGVIMDGARVTAIRLESGKTIRGRMFIDASYEGDLMAAVGVSFAVGREPNDKYGENLNGVQREQNIHKHRFVVPVDPYVVKGDPSSGLLAGIEPKIAAEGSGDKQIQAYCFRMCMTNHAPNRVPFPKPDNYDPKLYELLIRNFEAGDVRLPLSIGNLPNHKTDTNNNCAVSTDFIGMNYAYPEASYEERDQIVSTHRSYQQGLMWTLANHPRVPEKIRSEMSQWGLAKDEFVAFGHWPPQIYVREARRMLGQYVMTEADCFRNRLCKDAIGLGSYNMDSHNTQRYVDADGFVQNEGDVQVSPGGAYLISCGSILPRRNEAENLLVPVALSASHIAYGSIRMEPVFMILGQSAATLGVLAVEEKLAVQEVDYTKLRKRLLADGQVLDLPPNSPPRQLYLSTNLPGVVIDDRDSRCVRKGAWIASSSSSVYVDRGYQHDDNQGNGACSAEYRAKLSPGEYEVRVSFPPHSNRASNARYQIQHAGGQSVVAVDQRKPLAEKGRPFYSLGRFRFDASASVRVTNQKTDGYLILDAVQFLPAR